MNHRKKKVLISAPYFQPYINNFMDTFKANNIEIIVPQVNEHISEEELLKIVPEIEGAICGDDPFNEKVLSQAKKLKVICKWGTGIDAIDQEVCRKFGIAVKNTPNAFSEPIGDTIMGYVLCFARNLASMDKEVKNGVWKKIPGFALNERVLGVIGVGDIGKAVIRRAISFGMRVIGNDIKAISDDFIRETGIEMSDKDTLFRGSDFISLNCDLNPTSHHLINKVTLSKMKRSCVIINTARGKIIKEDDLIAALESKIISGAALDVFEQEPLPADSPLLKMDNVFLSPHNSNSSPRAWERVHQNTVNNLLLALKELQPKAHYVDEKNQK